MRRILYFFAFCCFFSCDIINPEEEIPSFIELESFTLLQTPNTGSNRENIKEGWVYVDNELIGAFAEGKPFPVLAEGTVDIIVDPGVHENGNRFTPGLYPYYTRYTTTVELVRGQTTVINPEFAYRDNITFKFIQDFENNTIFTADLDGNDETRITYTTDGALDGVSAKIELDVDNPTFNVGTNASYALPVTGPNDTYLEINFKTDVPLSLGLITLDNGGNVQQLYGQILNSTPVWKKVYVNLKQIILSNPTPPYQVGFAATLPSDQSSATIFVDNIKLLHFTE